MSKTGKFFAKGGIATAAVSAMALAGATPAQARDRHHDKIDAGDIIAGAVIIGGIAAIASAASKNKRDRYYHNDYRYRYDDRRYNDRRYHSGYNYRRGNPRRAVEKCIRAAERDARRYGYRFADVTEIRDVDRRSYGWRVKGRLVVDGNRGWGRYNTRYNRYERYDGYGRYDRGYDRDAGKFTCHIERGRVTDVNFRGLRGLR